MKYLFKLIEEDYMSLFFCEFLYDEEISFIIELCNLFTENVINSSFMIADLLLVIYFKLEIKWNYKRYVRIIRELKDMSILIEVANLDGVLQYEMGYSPYDLMRHIKEVQIGKQKLLKILKNLNGDDLR